MKKKHQFIPLLSNKVWGKTISQAASIQTSSFGYFVESRSTLFRQNILHSGLDESIIHFFTLKILVNVGGHIRKCSLLVREDRKMRKYLIVKIYVCLR